MKFFALLSLSAFAMLAQTPTITTVQNAYSYSSTLCPGLVATVYGSNFGSNATSVAVTVGGKTAYIFTSTLTANSVTVQIPFELSPGPTTVVISVAGTLSNSFNATLAAVSPSFITPNAAPSGLASVYTSTGTPITLAAPAHPGDTLISYAVGLGVTSPATPSGPVASGVSNSVSPLPSVTIGGVAAKVLGASVNSSLGPGFFQVNFTVPSSGVHGTEPLVLTMGSQSSSTMITIALIGTSAVANNASFANPGTIAPGSIASLFANGLGSASTNETTGLFPSTSSEGVEITFNGEAAPLFHLVPGASPQQIDFFVPTDLPTSGTVNVQLTTSSALYPNYTLKMVPASPGFYRFTDPKTSTQFVIAQFANSAWLVLPVSTTANLGLTACTATTSALTQCGEPATIGDYLTLYLTGLGLATPNGNPNGKPLPTGQNPPADGSVLYETPTLPTVTIGGIPAQVLFSGMAPGYAGEYQVDVQVPAGVTNGDNVPIVITMMGASDTTNISIQPGRVSPPGQ